MSLVPSWLRRMAAPAKSVVMNIPLTTLATGVHEFPATGGQAVSDTSTLLDLAVDRTPAGGLNSLTPATVVTIAVYQSNDGGATWNQLASAGLTGGVIINARTGQVNTQDVGVWLWPGTSRLVRAEVTVAGPSAVALSGTLTIS
jgi:hypothetical protein